MTILQRLKSYPFEVAIVALALTDVAGLIPTETKTALYASIMAAVSVAIRNALSNRLGVELTPEVLEIQAAELLPDGSMAEVREKIQQLDAKADQAYQRASELLESIRSKFPGPILLLCALTLLSGSAIAKEPKAIVSGPRYAEPGEDIYLDFSGSEGEPDRYHVSIHPNLPGRSQLEVLNGGTRARVKSYPGVWSVRVIVSNDDGWDEYTHTITIPGNPPCPTPPPSPNPIQPLPEPPAPPVPTPKPKDPTPTPVVPEPGRFALAPEVYRLASTSTSASRVTDCIKLAADCRRVAQAASNYASFTAMATDVVTTLNALPAGWEPLKSRTASAIKELYTSGKLQNRDDFAALLLELANAFDQAALVK